MYLPHPLTKLKRQRARARICSTGSFRVSAQLLARALCSGEPRILLAAQYAAEPFLSLQLTPSQRIRPPHTRTHTLCAAEAYMAALGREHVKTYRG